MGLEVGQVDWGATSVVAAILLFAFTGVMGLVAWIVKSRLEMMQQTHDAKLESMRSEFDRAVHEISERAQFNKDLYTTRLDLERQITDLATTSRDAMQRESEAVQELNMRIDRVGIALHPDAWAAFTDILIGAIRATATQVDWQSGMLERLAATDRVNGEVSADLRTAQRKLNRRVAPRLTELDLISPVEKTRETASRALADGVGDLETANHLLKLARIYPTFEVSRERLLSRLDETLPTVT